MVLLGSSILKQGRLLGGRMGSWWGGQLGVRCAAVRKERGRKGVVITKAEDLRDMKSVEELLALFRSREKSEKAVSAGRTSHSSAEDGAVVVAHTFHRLKEMQGLLFKQRNQRSWSNREWQNVEELLRILESQAMRQMSLFTTRHLGLIVNAYAAMRRITPDRVVLKALEERASLKMSEPRDVTNFVWAFAKLGIQPSGSMLTLVEGKVHGFNPQDIANFTWACATLGMQPPPELFRKICDRAEAVTPDFKPQNISSFMWACATLGMQPSLAMFGKMSIQAEGAIQDFKPQEISNFMWACATLEMKPPAELFSKMCSRVDSVAQDFNLQGVVNFTWACGVLRMQIPPETFRKMCARAETEFQDFIPQGLASLFWACAMLGKKPHAELFGKMCGKAEATMKDFKPQSIVNFMWACATLLIKPPEGLFGKFCTKTEAVIQDFKPKEVSDFLWACVTLGMELPEELYGKMCDRAEIVNEGFTPQEIANLIWSHAVFGRVSRGLGFFRARQYRLGADSISFEDWERNELCQAHQFLLSCDLTANLPPPEMKILRQLKEVNGERCMEAFTSVQDALSEHYTDVSSVVALCGAACQERCIDPVSGYLIDILVNTGEKRVAVEVEGPPVSASGESRRPKFNATTALKKRHLEQLGYHVVAVSYSEWRKMGTDMKKQYVQRRVLGKVRKPEKEGVGAKETRKNEGGGAQKEEESLETSV